MTQLSGRRRSPFPACRPSWRNRPPGNALWGGVAVLVGTLLAAASCGSSDRVVAVHQGAFGTPRPVPGILTAADIVQDASLSVQELEMYFASDRLGSYDIWRTTRAATDQPWAPPTAVTELSTADRELEPFLTADGLTLYFSRDTADITPDFRIFVAHRRSPSEPWEAPQMVSLGTPATDNGATTDAAQLHMVFGSIRGGTNEFDLYEVRRNSVGNPWGEPVPLTELNSPTEDWDPGLFADGLALAYSSRRADGISSDLYLTTRATAAEPFGAPQPMTELNSPMSEGDPWLSNDGRHVVFTSDRDGGAPHLYEAFR